MFTKSQSGFLSCDSCVSQLLSNHETYNTPLVLFACNTLLNVRGTFVTISKVFEDEGLIFKLQTYDINGKLVNLMQDLLNSRQQRVILNGQMSSGEKVLLGEPQGSVLDSFLLLIYINDILEGIKSICKLFADDAWIF